jgi:predicted porin
MKKHLIAAAVAAAVAGPALAQVTISGALDTSHVNAKKVGTGSQSQSYVSNSLRSSSHIRFTTAEDLGGGLKAHLFLEQSLGDADTGVATNFARGAFVGVSGGFGTVNLGKPNATFLSTLPTYNNFAGNVAGLNTTGTSFNSRPNNAIQYISPTFNGVNLQVVHSVGGETATAATKDNLKQTQLSLQGKIGNLSFIVGTSQEKTAVAAVAGTAARYIIANGTAGQVQALADAAAVGVGADNTTPHAIAAYAIIQDLSGTPTGNVTARLLRAGTAAVAASTGKIKNDGLGITYDFGVAQVTYSMMTGKTDNTVTATGVTSETGKFKAQGVFAQSSFGAVSPFVSYRTHDNRLNADGNDHKAYTVGVTYALSKRTNVYGLFDKVVNESASTAGNINTAGSTRVAGNAGDDPSIIAIGLRHSF